MTSASALYAHFPLFSSVCGGALTEAVQSHPVSKLFDYVANKNGMSPGAVELRFDGDKLSGSAIIVDTGIEDEDIVDVVIKGK